MLGIPWNPLRAILFSSLGSLLPTPEPTKIPVYLMLPLDAALPTPTMSLQALSTHLDRLSNLGAEGIMLDIWWGLCEPTPSSYNFTNYITILRLVADAGLRAQPVLSCHSCGGNIGDSVNIPLPDWAVRAADDADAWFQDACGSINREYISFGADRLAFLPSATGARTPVDAYAAFAEAFLAAVQRAGLSDVLVELQVGLGPCGELRYPSYPGGEGKWEFPGIGAFQCHDKHLTESFRTAQGGRGGAGMPDETGYNDKPWDSRFFRSARRTHAGRAFLDWYSGELLRHGDDVLAAVRRVTDLQLAVKVSGVHWWYHHSSRAAESTTGYINSRGSIYRAIARLCKTYDAVLDFTCLEMRSFDQPLWARCGPRQLVSEVFGAAAEAGVGVAGENALERWDWKAFRQVAKAFRRSRARGVGFTQLRLSDNVPEWGWVNLERFVKEMNKT